ncbi:hypothetical protein BC936DRAFT_136789 [Jimgerdemannia flammicorona]|uniref:Uncharacterized protein n=1 Tax=Jimgerdemannia flammicorona TaxID=994334 RepID=A0A433CYT5_9FUNG|nr:hypothetical protein BC936DRAFT_136789 [Jimgerdemannia flammicorona]
MDEIECARSCDPVKNRSQSSEVSSCWADGAKAYRNHSYDSCDRAGVGTARVGSYLTDDQNMQT